MTKKAWSTDDSAAAAAVLSSAAGSGAYIGKYNHINDYNPFGKKTVTVVGGVKPWDYALRQSALQTIVEATQGKHVPTDKLEAAKRVFMLDSFSGQSQGAADALKGSGINVSVVNRASNNPFRTLDKSQVDQLKQLGFDTRAIDQIVGSGNTVRVFDRENFYRPHDLSLADLKGSDAVLQVGDSASDTVLKSARRKGKKIYRLLSDYGDGNFLQPDQWLGEQNWMKIRDPKMYDRLFVPGMKERDLWKNLGRGRSRNVAVGDIAVSPIFEGMSFAHHGEPGVRAMLTVGGGAGSSLSFNNRFAPEAKRYNFIGPDNSLLDDIMQALRRKHGDAAKLDVYLGSTIAKPEFVYDREAKRIAKGHVPSDVRLSKKFQQLSSVLNGDSSDKLVARLERTARGRQLLESVRRRYRGVNLIDHPVPQSDIANAYRSSDYIFALPGSTTAEFSAIKGNKHGGLIHLIPPEVEWAPRHFRGNANYVNRMMQPGAKHNIVELSARNRGQQLIDAVAEGGFKEWGRRGTVSGKTSLSPLVNTIKRDIALKRLGRVGKLGLLLTPGVVGGTYLAKKLLHRNDSPLERIKRRLGI